MEKFLKDQEEQREAIKNLTSQMGQLFAHNKMLENQISAQASSSRQSGKLPSQPEHPGEQAKAITLRSGKQLPKEEATRQENEENQDTEVEQQTEVIKDKKEEKKVTPSKTLVLFLKRSKNPC